MKSSDIEALNEIYRKIDNLYSTISELKNDKAALQDQIAVLKDEKLQLMKDNLNNLKKLEYYIGLVQQNEREKEERVKQILRGPFNTCV